MSGYQEAGNAYINGRPAYYDMNPDGTMNLFPGGMPDNTRPHDHYVVNQDGGVEYMHENGQVINDYRQYGR